MPTKVRCGECANPMEENPALFMDMSALRKGVPQFVTVGYGSNGPFRCPTGLPEGSLLYPEHRGNIKRLVELV